MTVEAATARSESDGTRVGAFVVATLLSSWTIALVTVTDTVPAYTAPLIMLVPAVVALAVRRIGGTGLRATVARSLRGSTVPSLAFAVLYPVGFIGLAALVALVTGLGAYRPGVENAVDQVLAQGGVVAVPVFLLINLALTYGEELGWRGYLLPELTDRRDRVTATLAVGVVWGLYHSAFLYSAAAALGVERPLLVTAVQAGAVVTVSFPFAYSYYLTDGSVFPAMVFHLVWNVLNPWILGDVYGNARGLVAGQVFLVSGEGALGLALGAVAAVGFAVLFRRDIGLPAA
ncbi:MAG: type II CAAX prenyl endopeptidase Rce1 family protein [Halosimplex sp.]